MRAGSDGHDDRHGRYTLAFEQHPFAFMSAGPAVASCIAAVILGSVAPVFGGPAVTGVLTGVLAAGFCLGAAAYRPKGSLVITDSEVRVDAVLGRLPRRHTIRLRTQSTRVDWEPERLRGPDGSWFWSLTLGMHAESVDLRWLHCTPEDLIALADALDRFREIGGARAGSAAEVPEALRRTARAATQSARATGGEPDA